MNDDQGTFDFGGPKEPKFTKGKMVVKLFPDHFTANGHRFDRPDGLTNQAILEACEKENKCFHCRHVMGINFMQNINRAMLDGLYGLYHLQKRNGTFDKYVEASEIVEHLSRKWGSNVKSVVSKNKYFGLLQKMEGPRPVDMMATKTGSGKTGFYRMTHRGRRFVENKLAIQVYCAVYIDQNLNCYGPLVSVSEHEVKDFNWKEAFYGAPPKT